MEVNTNFSSVGDLWNCLMDTRGETNSESTRYTVVDLADDRYHSLLLIEIWENLHSLLESNPHFSEEVRTVGKRILSQLEIVQLESEQYRKRQYGFLKRWYNSPLVDDDKKWISIRKDHVLAYLNYYTTDQWRVVFPRRRPPPFGCSYQWSFNGGPTRYLPAFSTEKT